MTREGPKVGAKDSNLPVCVVGAGLAGLSCALTLHRAGYSVSVIEASEAPGGRVASIEHNGFTLDVGFQVYLSSYKHPRQLLNIAELKLSSFDSAAVVLLDGHRFRLSHPGLYPHRALESLRAPFFHFRDAWGLANLAKAALLSNDQTSAAQTTREFLTQRGFSAEFIQRFFTPFFGGIYLDDTLSQPASIFLRLLRNFVVGKACLPQRGMRRIPELIAAQLPASALHYGKRAAELSDRTLVLESGERLEGSAVILACGERETARLLGSNPPEPEFFGTRCHYFSTTTPPVRSSILLLQGDSESVINSVHVPSIVQPSYAPPGRHLVSCTTWFSPDRDLDTDLQSCESELRLLFGSEVESWEHLRSFEVSEALPKMNEQNRSAELSEGVFRCGDYLLGPSIDDAVRSGIETAELFMKSC